MISFFPVTDSLGEGFHIRIFFEIPKQVEQEKAYGIIGKTQRFVCMGDDGSNEKEIYKWGDKSVKAAADRAIGIDFNVASLIGVLG